MHPFARSRAVRPYLRVNFALLLLALASPTLLVAQFRQPTDQELNMTADPKASGAAAVYLYLEDITDQTNETHTIYERIKILTEKGKDLATVRIPYETGVDKVADIEARTIHSDGTVIPLTEKPSDLVDYKTKQLQYNTMVFTLPGAEVGSILEYRAQVKYAGGVGLPTWWIQQPYFVRAAHFSLKEFSGSSDQGYVSRIGSGDKVVNDKKGNYTLDLTDVPALPDDDWMPPLNTYKWRVEFIYPSVYKTDTAFWEDAGKTWSSVIREFINPTGTLKKAAAEIVAPGDSETQKAEKIYAAVMKLENTDFTRRKSEVERKKEKIREINKAEDVWNQQSGTSDEIALLYVALARAAGLNVEPMMVVDRSRALFDKSYQTSRQLDDYIAVGRLDGKEIFLDPGQKMCPFGLLHWKHTVASGFRLNDKVSEITQTPAGNFKTSSVQRVADLVVDSTGGVEGVIRFVMTGQSALYWRQLALENDQEEVKKQFNESMKDSLPEGIQAGFDHFLGLQDYPRNLMGIVNVSGSLGTATGKHFFLPGLFFESRAKHPFVAQDKREIPVDVHYPKVEQDDVTYHLPPGYTVESAPQESSISWPEHAILKVASKTDAGTVNVARILMYNYTILGPADYPDLRDFYRKVAAADQQQLVLVRAPLPKGN
jgi:hypothetical protein